MATTRGIEAPDYDDLLSEKLWNEILPGLWQGGTHDNDVLGDETFVVRRNSSVQAFIQKTDFDTVVTAYQYANPVDWFVNEHRYCFYDASIALVDKKRLRQAVDFAYDSWKSGDSVLIRCQAGLNRSGLITALVLIKDGYEPAEAISLIREKRNRYALCNKDFEQWLLELDVDEWRI
jgi:hypothetical protein